MGCTNDDVKAGVERNCCGELIGGRLWPIFVVLYSVRNQTQGGSDAVAEVDVRYNTHATGTYR